MKVKASRLRPRTRVILTDSWAITWCMEGQDYIGMEDEDNISQVKQEHDDKSSRLLKKRGTNSLKVFWIAGRLERVNINEVVWMPSGYGQFGHKTTV